MVHLYLPPLSFTHWCISVLPHRRPVETCKHTYVCAFSSHHLHGRLYACQQFHLRNYVVVFVELPQFPQKQSTLGKTTGINNQMRVFSSLTCLWGKGSQSLNSNFWTLHQLPLPVHERDLQKSKQYPFLITLLSPNKLGGPWSSRKDSFFPFAWSSLSASASKVSWWSTVYFFNLSWADNFIK